MGQSKAECKVGGIGWEVKVEVERLPYLTDDSGTASGGQHTSWRHAVMVEVYFGGVSAPLVPQAVGDGFGDGPPGGGHWGKWHAGSKSNANLPSETSWDGALSPPVADALAKVV